MNNKIHPVSRVLWRDRLKQTERINSILVVVIVQSSSTQFSEDCSIVFEILYYSSVFTVLFAEGFFLSLYFLFFIRFNKISVSLLCRTQQSVGTRYRVKLVRICTIEFEWPELFWNTIYRNEIIALYFYNILPTFYYPIHFHHCTSLQFYLQKVNGSLYQPWKCLLDRKLFIQKR